MIEIDQLQKVYAQGTEPVVALNDISFQVNAGDRFAILGRSGSGKSTLLNLLAGLDRPSKGTLTVNGNRLDLLTKNQLAEYRCKQVGIVFQSFRLFDHLSASQNVEVPLALAGMPFNRRKNRVAELLALVQLSHRASHRPSMLSGGEQQRVAIARALANQPSVLLADEPTGNLDAKTARAIEDLIVEVCETTETTLAVVTHDEPLANRITNEIVRLEDGEIIESTIECGVVQ